VPQAQEVTETSNPRKDALAATPPGFKNLGYPACVLDDCGGKSERGGVQRGEPTE